MKTGRKTRKDKINIEADGDTNMSIYMLVYRQSDIQTNSQGDGKEDEETSRQ